MSYTLPGNNFNQRGVVHRFDEVCRTVIGGGGSGGYHAGNEPKVIVRCAKKSMSASSRLAETPNTQHGESRGLKPSKG